MPRSRNQGRSNESNLILAAITFAKNSDAKDATAADHNYKLFYNAAHGFSNEKSEIIKTKALVLKAKEKAKTRKNSLDGSDAILQISLNIIKKMLAAPSVSKQSISGLSFDSLIKLEMAFGRMQDDVARWTDEEVARHSSIFVALNSNVSEMIFDIKVNAFLKEKGLEQTDFARVVLGKSKSIQVTRDIVLEVLKFLENERLPKNSTLVMLVPTLTTGQALASAWKEELNLKAQISALKESYSDFTFPIEVKGEGYSSREYLAECQLALAHHICSNFLKSAESKITSAQADKIRDLKQTTQTNGTVNHVKDTRTPLQKISDFKTKLETYSKDIAYEPRWFKRFINMLLSLFHVKPKPTPGQFFLASIAPVLAPAAPSRALIASHA